MKLVLGAVAVAALAVGATTTARPLPSMTCAQAIDVPGEQPPPAQVVHGFAEAAQGRIWTALFPSFPVPPPSASP